MAMKLIKNAVPLIVTGKSMAPITICLIHNLPPSLAYRPPPKKPFIGEDMAYMKITVFKSEPRLYFKIEFE
jgi:hypothetical protein